MNTQTFFNEKLPQIVKNTPEKVSDFSATFVIKVSGDGGGTWTLDLGASPPAVREGESDDADCIVETTDSDFDSMLADPQLGMQLFLQGRLQVTGDPMLASKLADLLAIE